jgi:hypothetical protein
MTDTSEFTESTVAMIVRWHGVAPPNATALAMVGDLVKVIADFEALRGNLRFEDEPSSFEAALLEAAAVEVKP